MTAPLARQSGAKEQRYAHILGDPALLADPGPAQTPAREGLAERVATLEREVAELRAALDRLSANQAGPLDSSR